MRVSDPVWLYVLRCGDGSLYTGTAADVDARLALHRAGRGAKYTRGRGPLEAVLRHSCAERSEALRLEAAVKKLPRAEKERLIAAPEAECEAFLAALLKKSEK
jgi:pyrroline-5-carboxylate reductase